MFFKEEVYHVLPELKLRRIFLAVHFVNTNLTVERFQVLLSEKERKELPDNSLNNFKKSNIDRCMERPIERCAIPNFMQILPDNGITEGINSLNLNKRKVFGSCMG